MDQERLARMSPESRARVEEWQRMLKLESEEDHKMMQEIIAKKKASQANLGKTTTSTSENPRD